MKYEIGFITAWRRMIFLSLVFTITIFGTVSSVCSSLISVAIIGNVISVGALVLGVAFVIFVAADKLDRYKDFGTIDFDDSGFVYNDRKRHINLKYSDILKVDIENIMLGQNSKVPLAYRILIKTKNKKIYIESDRALGRAYTEMDIYKLYLDIQSHI